MGDTMRENTVPVGIERGAPAMQKLTGILKPASGDAIIKEKELLRERLTRQEQRLIELDKALRQFANARRTAPADKIQVIAQKEAELEGQEKKLIELRVKELMALHRLSYEQEATTMQKLTEACMTALGKAVEGATGPVFNVWECRSLFWEVGCYLFSRPDESSKWNFVKKQGHPVADFGPEEVAVGLPGMKNAL